MSSTSGLSSCCISGHIHDGIPTGVVEKIGGLDVYVAKPEDGSQSKTILFITDVFGFAVPNARLLADDYARAGFYVYVPDFHQGDSFPSSLLQNVAPLEPEKRTGLQAASDTEYTLLYTIPWLGQHSDAVVRPLMDNVVVSNHPSFTTEPEFLNIAKPTQINVGTNDIFLSNALIAQIKTDMAQKTHVPYEMNVFEGAVHGFANRGDLTNARQKAIKEEAFVYAIRWLNKYLA
ncbi:hypothetical protein CALCODRAFT_511811 [Calocera cornea HHB12733]|uniref:Dienelactone hydrolase domain-containing protein n=1 Tax=Calocera cornea HHB12733 TaxID=1353952 RepID=A0A165DHR1_9BASI|nr:hypothetical protein CALCODRAFT_511811 [Calocera cornea HHB12733]